MWDPSSLQIYEFFDKSHFLICVCWHTTISCTINHCVFWQLFFYSDFLMADSFGSRQPTPFFGVSSVVEYSPSRLKSMRSEVQPKIWRQWLCCITCCLVWDKYFNIKRLQNNKPSEHISCHCGISYSSDFVFTLPKPHASDWSGFIR